MADNEIATDQHEMPYKPGTHQQGIKPLPSKNEQLKQLPIASLPAGWKIAITHVVDALVGDGRGPTLYQLWLISGDGNPSDACLIKHRIPFVSPQYLGDYAFCAVAMPKKDMLEFQAWILRQTLKDTRQKLYAEPIVAVFEQDEDATETNLHMVLGVSSNYHRIVVRGDTLDSLPVEFDVHPPQEKNREVATALFHQGPAT